METGASIFLDALCLAMHPKTKGIRKILLAMIGIYDTYKEKDEFLKTDMVRTCIALISEIMNEELDPQNKNDYQTTILKLEEFITRESPEFAGKLMNIVNTGNNITDMKLDRLKQSLNLWILQFKTNKCIYKMFSECNKSFQTTNELKKDIHLTSVVDSAREIIDNFDNRESKNVDMIEHIDFSKIESIKKAFKINHTKITKGRLNLGLQGVERLFGKRGPLRGEFIMFAALSHHYKSGILMDMLRWLITHNFPKVKEGKIPTIVFISLENEIHENMMQWFRAAYKNYFSSDGSELSDDAIIDVIKEVFNKNGFNVQVFRRMGENFGYQEYVNLHVKLQSSGCEIVASFLDYISKMRLEEGGVNDAKKRENLLDKVADFCRHNAIFGVSAAQLGPAAEELYASGKINIVKRLTAYHIADCKGLRKGADIFIFAHIEINKFTGRKYLTLKQDKQRQGEETLEEDKYCAYEFIPGKGILDDRNGKDSSIKDIYGEKTTTNNIQLI